ncbi:hypothetical protein ANN_22043 [Periplaneta americana]|uniref:Uncharacterized protein n=1 Tax=Periplaneta americana TaxID=6978 RepID=A0ABQ8S714_PERAM|nr:hypothetical protein ANN_22043 [Periplaneta americana]
MERLKRTDRIRNEAVLERMGEERIMLKLVRKRKRNWLGQWLRRHCVLKDALEGMVNGRRVRGRRRYQMINDIKIYGSYEETKRKTKNRKDWRKRLNEMKVIMPEKWVQGPAPKVTQQLLLMDRGKTSASSDEELKSVVQRWLYGQKTEFYERDVLNLVSRWGKCVERRGFYVEKSIELYSPPDIIRNIKSRCLRWAGYVASMGESRNAYRVLIGRPEGKIPLGTPRRRWENNIKMDLREVRYGDRDWIDLAQDRDLGRAYVRAAMNLRVL